MSGDRKSDHINQAFSSRTGLDMQDQRFNYEPLLVAHPQGTNNPVSFLGKKMGAPIWVSSMTGGTGAARKINENIARVCHEFGLGMGLGSCRKILNDKAHWADFDFRNIIGDELPFYANLGIAQLEKIVAEQSENKVVDLVSELKADGLIIHINPLQEWFQPEGDQISKAPIDTITAFLDRFQLPVIVKEVGQGMGPESLKQLLKLPLAAIEFGAFGGTNFSKLEMQRTDDSSQSVFEPFSKVGQSAEQMLRNINHIVAEEKDLKCNELIISGGITNFLDGYYLMSISKMNAVFGMASQVLKYASESYEALYAFMDGQIKALQLAQTYLKVNPDYA